MIENIEQKVFMNRVKVGTSILIGGNVKVTLDEIDGYETKLTITAPNGVKITSDYLNCDTIESDGALATTITENPEATSVFIGDYKVRVKRVHGSVVDFKVTTPAGVTISEIEE